MFGNVKYLDYILLRDFLLMHDLNCYRVVIEH